MTKGIVYCAQGMDYLEEALISIASSLRDNHVPHVLFCDSPVRLPEGVEFSILETCGNPLADRIEAMIKSPFSQTIYLDTDTYVTNNITGLFDLLHRFDLAAALAPGYRGYADAKVPSCFCEFNAGVIVYRRGRNVSQFLEDWRDTYLDWVKDPPFPGAGSPITGDQPAFRRCAWESALSVYVLPPEYNYRTRFPGFLVGQAKIIHGRTPNYEALVTRLNSTLGPRCFPKLTRK